MKELEFIEIIKKTLSKSSHIGDDCAYLDDLGMVITQDNLVEDIHFSQKYATPFQIAYKAIMVNLSDIFASGAVPKYITISISLPKYIDKDFIKEFYKSCEDLSQEYDFEIVGGDITGSEKIFISICAIGLTKDRKISSRKNAKVGDFIITTGVHGSSVAGLWILNNSSLHPQLISGSNELSNLTKIHLEPIAQKKLSEEISTKVTTEYAMMDTSDGLADALYKIGQASNVLMYVDFDKIPYDKQIEKVAKLADINYEDWIFYGGEDFQIVACVSEETLKKIDKTLYSIIGQVKEKREKHCVEIDFGDKIEKISNLEKTYNHFGRNNEN